MKLLRIDSSARTRSVSRSLTSKFVEQWREHNPEGSVVDRDLASTPLPHITDQFPTTAAAEFSADQREYLALSDTLITELLDADVVVIGSPMHNFTVSWELKAWIDQIVRLGKTIAYGPNGPRGLVSGKRAVVITSRGGSYRPGTPRSEGDFQETYLRYVLAFIGIKDVQFIHAELQYRAAEADAGITRASEEIAGAIQQHMLA